MPRDASGNMTLSAGNPVLAGTPIDPLWANLLTEDLRNEMQQSLSRLGKGGMVAPLRTQDGLVSAPAHSFTNDTDSGMYSGGANDVRLAVGGADVVAVTSGGVAVAGQVKVANGTAANPSLTFTNEPDTGLYTTDTDDVRVAAGGVEALRVEPTGITVPGTAAIAGNETVGGTLEVTGLATFTAGADMTNDRIRNVGAATVGTDALPANSAAPTVLIYGAEDTDPPPATNFLVPGSGTANTTERFLILPFACKISNLRIFSNDAPVGGAVTYTVRKTLVDTALVATQAAGSTTASDTTNSFTAVAGDAISIEAESGGGVSAMPNLITAALRVDLF